MKIFLIALLNLNFLTLVCQSSNDAYVKGLSVCLDKNEFLIVQELYKAVDNILDNYGLNSKNKYYQFAYWFLEDKIDKRIFKVNEGTDLDLLIREALSCELYYQRELRDGPIIIDGEEVEIVPPGGAIKKRHSKDIEKIHLNYNKDFVSCSSLFTTSSVISIFYSQSESLGVASSKIKLSGINKLIKPEDYKLSSVKYFIVFNVIMQKIMHTNNYKAQK